MVPLLSLTKPAIWLIEIFHIEAIKGSWCFEDEKGLEVLFRNAEHAVKGNNQRINYLIMVNWYLLQPILFTGSWTIRADLFWGSRSYALYCTWSTCYSLSKDAFKGSYSVGECDRRNPQFREGRLCGACGEHLPSFSTPHISPSGLSCSTLVLVKMCIIWKPRLKLDNQAF